MDGECVSYFSIGVIFLVAIVLFVFTREKDLQ